MEPFAGERVAAALRDERVDVRLSTSPDSVAPHGAAVALSVGGDRCRGRAAGRHRAAPNTADLGLDTVGLEAGHALEIDDSGLVAGVDGQWLYAVGDVTGRAPLTHQGKYQAPGSRGPPSAPGPRAARWTPGRGASTPRRPTTRRGPAGGVHRPGGGVGRATAAEQARAAGLDCAVIDLPIAVAGSSLHADGYDGAVRMVVDRTGEVRRRGDLRRPGRRELLHAATVAVVGEVPLGRLWHAVPAYPTMSEIWLQAAGAVPGWSGRCR